MQHSDICQYILNLPLEMYCSLIHIEKELTLNAMDLETLVELREEYVLVKCRAGEFPLNEFMKTAAIRLQRTNRLFYFNLYGRTRATRCVFVAFRLNLYFIVPTLNCWENWLSSTLLISLHFTSINFMLVKCRDTKPHYFNAIRDLIKNSKTKPWRKLITFLVYP